MSYVGTSRSSSSSCSRQRTETSGQQAAVPKFLLLWPGLRCSWTRRADMATVSTATFPCLDRRKLKAINTAFSVSRLLQISSLHASAHLLASSLSASAAEQESEAQLARRTLDYAPAGRSPVRLRRRPRVGMNKASGAAWFRPDLRRRADLDVRRPAGRRRLFRGLRPATEEEEDNTVGGPRESGVRIRGTSAGSPRRRYGMHLGVQ